MRHARVEGYDLIGDVHGCGATLAVLLERLGYHQRDGVYRHPRRKAIFVGDLIDRGPRIRLAVRIARRMVEDGQAHVVLGNHEINALTYTLKAPPELGREWLRPHTPRHNRIIKETLEQYHDHPQEWDDTLAWFRDIPLFLEFDDFRVVHACWDQTLITQLRRQYPDGRIDTDFLYRASTPGSDEFRILERLTRGGSISLPEGVVIHSGDGFTRRSFRTHFWARCPSTWGDVVFQPDNLPNGLERQPLSDRERAKLSYYAPDERPLFIGHYWCEGVPALPAPNIACLDYSAVKYGRLVAYRYSFEPQLDADRFVWVPVPRDAAARPEPREIDFD
ncbi:hypothetical protein HCU01_31620 [Halomonas cupida]|uniref:Calcineurin-like phosphoesterase n=1 Tax=Halomonas cupida TaxID=44933 RepID=A0A1M7LBE7_9GAMM|nr:metallophosphoesterase [Halomonas cupida]GEN25213.1 hypothetical protein HCU01_31620 [Halomonas cupida]SHM75484.1 Calcineurin-like phosphoesterase [Halomonas cupida]